MILFLLGLVVFLLVVVLACLGHLLNQEKALSHQVSAVISLLQVVSHGQGAHAQSHIALSNQVILLTHSISRAIADQKILIVRSDARES